MKRNRWLYISLFALICGLFGWWLFTAGYYFSLTRAEKEKAVLLSDDVVVLKYAAEELKKNNSKRAIEILQGMTEVKGTYIRATHKTLGELSIVSLALHPITTIDILFSEDPKSYRLIKETTEQ